MVGLVVTDISSFSAASRWHWVAGSVLCELTSGADKIRVVSAAEADADAAHLQCLGIARQRSKIIDGPKESIASGTASQLTCNKVSERTLITQYFEMFRDICATSTIFTSHSAGTVTDVSNQIRSGVLQVGGHAACMWVPVHCLLELSLVFRNLTMVSSHANFAFRE